MLPKSTDYILCEKQADDTLLVVVSGKKTLVFKSKPKFEAKHPDKVYEVHPCRCVAGGMKVGTVLVTMQTMVDRSMNKMELWKDKFEQVFGVGLRQFWDGLCGFNAVKFDEQFVKPADGVSGMQAVEQRWGNEGVAIIRGILTPTN